MKPRSNGRLIARKLLDTTQWFEAWETADIDNIFRHCELREYDKSETLYLDGNSREVLLVVTGTVWTCLRQGTTKVKFGMLFAGSLIGLAQLVRSNVPDDPCYEFMAAENTLALAIPQGVLLEVMNTRPQLWRGMAESAILYQRHCIKIALLLYTGSTRERLISALYQFGVSRSIVPSRPPDNQIMLSQSELSLLVQSSRPPDNQIMLSQSELSLLVQSSRPHVNKALRELEAKGLIGLSYKCILILQPDELAALAAHRLTALGQ